LWRVLLFRAGGAANGAPGGYYAASAYAPVEAAERTQKSIVLGTEMEESNPISEELVAPCGMNCAICSRYLSFVNNLKRSECVGCRPRNEPCEYLFKKCTGINHTSEDNVAFCYECDQYPCKQINRMDDRYRENYGMSVKDNLGHINQMGIEDFIEEQYRIHRCPKCNGLVSIHNRKCFVCDTVTRLVEKRNKQYRQT
jgi:hypothetical protein